MDARNPLKHLDTLGESLRSREVDVVVRGGDEEGLVIWEALFSTFIVRVLWHNGEHWFHAHVNAVDDMPLFGQALNMGHTIANLFQGSPTEALEELAEELWNPHQIS